ncbi:DUF2378 family protein [Archangium lipolyticum]|uniref:DUF2378 family protein n=1 Tax=Archangium lipolyticum TaxID=2970465 RepID=UPI00214A1BC7|nr:DUF2378 family protein [Archangium lipolyticum]
MSLPSTSVIPTPELEHLLTLTTPEDTCRGMFFNGLFDAVRSLGGEEARARCYVAAGAKKFVDFFSYPIADFLKALFTAAELLGPKHGGRDAVMHLLGRRATEDFHQSTVGKTMLALAGRDPHRVVNSFPTAFRASLSTGNRTVELLGDKQARFRVRRELLPMAYNEGVLTYALEQSSAKEIVVRGHRLAPLDIDYDIRWS